MSYNDLRVSNRDFYTLYKQNLESILSSKNLCIYKIVKKSKKIKDNLIRVIKFLDILLKLEDSSIKVKPLISTSVSINNFYEEYEKKDNDELVKNLEKLYIDEGKTLVEVDRIYSKYKK